MTVKGTGKSVLHKALAANVTADSVIMTDEHKGYIGVGKKFAAHKTVNHSAGEYRNGAACTNSVEAVWALLKRGVYGTWHQVSAKHLDRYVNEVAFRLNEGQVQHHTLDRLDSFIKAVDGKRLTYARLTQ
jgi:hypothetical protein